METQGNISCTAQFYPAIKFKVLVNMNKKSWVIFQNKMKTIPMLHQHWTVFIYSYWYTHGFKQSLVVFGKLSVKVWCPATRFQNTMLYRSLNYLVRKHMHSEPGQQRSRKLLGMSSGKLRLTRCKKFSNKLFCLFCIYVRNAGSSTKSRWH